MRRGSPAGPLVLGLCASVIATGCSTGAATASLSKAPTAASPLAISTKFDIPYESSNRLLEPGTLDVYAPAAAGRWPVVVMFHGSPQSVSKEYLHDYAMQVAGLGYVVFVAAWGHVPGASPDAVPGYDEASADTAEGACAVAFARSHAAEHGGDPATLILFGHSAGANEVAMIAFARPAPTPGCLGGTDLGGIHALITWEGDFLLAAPGFDAILTADHRVMASLSPWTYLAQHKDLRTVMLVSSDPGADLERPLEDASAVAAFFAPRDPSGDLRSRLEAAGALAGHSISVTDEQQLLFSVLKSQGNPVSLHVMPGSSHEYLSGAG